MTDKTVLMWTHGDPVKRVVARDPEAHHKPPKPKTISGEGITVAVLSPSEGLGGAERQTRALALGLEALGFTVRRGSTAEPPEADVTIWWGAHLPGNVTGPQIYVAHSEECAVPADVDMVVGVCSGQGDVTIWNGVDPAPFEGLQKRPRPGPGEVFTVGWLGRYEAEKNPVLAVEVLAELPDNFRLVMHGKGPLRGAVYQRACELGVQDAVYFGGVVPPERAMGNFDCLLITSDREGLPLVAVEAMHSGVPVVAKAVGDIPMLLADGRGCFSMSTKDLQHSIMDLANNRELAAQERNRARAYAAKHLTAERMAEQYAKAVLSMRRPNLMDEVTAFLIHCGEASAPEARRRLEEQTVKVRIEEIAHVAPMDRAFQAMIDRCETPYYVQVDADMLLEPWAIATLHEHITDYGSDVFVGYLWGDVEQQPIQGVKIYRHQICKRHSFTESLSCEWGHQDGLSVVVQDHPMATREHCYGTHKVLQSREVAFRRGKRLMQKLRAAPGQMAFFAHLMRKVRSTFLLRPSTTLLDMYTGMVTGAMGPMPEDKELDAMKMDPDLRRLNWLLGRAQDGPQEVTLYLTSKCNHRCTWCRKQHEDEEPVPDMSPTLVQRVLHVHPTIRSVLLCGFGEPLLYPDMEEVMAICREHGSEVQMVSNGSLMARHAQGLLDWGMKEVTISLNAATAETHFAVADCDTWDAVMYGLKELRGVGLPFRLSMVVCKESILEVPDFIRLAAEVGASGVHLHNLLPHGQPDFLDEVITCEDAAELARLEEFKQLPGAELVRTWPVPIGGLCPRLCESPFVSIGVDGLGNLTPCRRVLPPHERFGSLHGNNWIGEDFQRYRGVMLGDHDLPVECRFCFGAWSQ